MYPRGLLTDIYDDFVLISDIIVLADFLNCEAFIKLHAPIMYRHYCNTLPEVLTYHPDYKELMQICTQYNIS